MAGEAGESEALLKSFLGLHELQHSAVQRRRQTTLGIYRGLNGFFAAREVRAKPEPSGRLYASPRKTTGLR